MNGWSHVPMNRSALGTLWSPLWITDEPTQPLRAFCARLRMACIMRDVLGADCTRFKPWPVSRRRYGMVSESKSCSASDHRWNISDWKRRYQSKVLEKRQFQCRRTMQDITPK